MALTQVQGEDQEEEEEIEEGVKGEGASEVLEIKKRKDTTMATSKLRRVAKLKPTVPSTRENTRATTNKVQE